MRKFFHLRKRVPDIGGRRMLASMALTMAFVSVTYAQWVDVTDTYIKDADFSSGTNNFWADGTLRPTVDANEKNAEFYEKVATAAQRIEGMVPGQYKLTVRGFRREGGNDNGAAYETGTEEINALLFAGDNETPLASLYSASKNSAGGILSNGWPDRMSSMRLWCDADPTIYVNELEFTVAEAGDLLIGINSKVGGGKRWTCWSDFKLYFYGSSFDVFQAGLTRLESYRNSFHDLGFAASAELTAIIDSYSGYNESTPVEELEAASIALNAQIEIASTISSDCSIFETNLEKAELLFADCESEKYIVNELVKGNLSTSIEEANNVKQLASIEALAATVKISAEEVDNVYNNTMSIINITYPLLKVKELADRIGQNIDDTEEYRNVITDLAAANPSFDDVTLHIQALNMVCSNAMTDDFLNVVTSENPIDLTSFIVNPNIYQSNAGTENPAGWICERNGADDKMVTSNGYGDSEFNCYSWSGSVSNSIGKSHYWQKIGGDTESAVGLPDGLYMLKAATVTTAGADQILLYASSDNVNFSKANFNRDEAAYNNARKELGTTTEAIDVVVRGGTLYLGIRGKYLDDDGYVGGNGRWWHADNFRLYYTGRTAAYVYQERLQERIDEGEVLHNTLANHGIEDEILTDYLATSLPLLESESIEDIEVAIARMDELIEEAKVVISNYEELSECIVAGRKLSTQLEQGAIVVQPGVASTFAVTLENAELVYAELSWDNMYANTTAVAIALQEASTAFKISGAICYPLNKAKLLAENIGGMSDNTAYLKVVSDLQNDGLNQAEAELDVATLNAECVKVMTPVVLATASIDNPFDMTSFIANPNILQNKEEYSKDQVNGWIYDGIYGQGGRDHRCMTAADNGDTWLLCSSWSGNAGNNVGLGNNYYQVVGANGEETVALPNGIYRISAATYSEVSGQISLYAVTRKSYIADGEVVYKDSVEYASRINGNKEAWELSQLTVGTTTDVLDVYVRNGSLCIGVKGNSVVGGTGRSWIADNFRLYYVGALGDEVHNDDGVVAVYGDLEAALEEIAEIKNITSLDLSNVVASEGATEISVQNPNTIVYGLPEGVTLGTSCIDAQDKETPFLLCEEYPFNAPIACEEVNLQYVRNFTTTTNNDNGGWQSIVLPFDVETITAIQDGNEIELIPFAQWDEMGKEVAKEQGLRPFWLLEAAYDESIKDEGYASADAIKANVPYLIAIPNDPAFYDAYFNVSGDVTFSGKGVQVTELYSETVEGYTLNTNFNGPTSDVYGLNTEGTDWVAGIDANSFHLYVTTSQANAPQRIAIFGNGGGTTGIKGIFSDFGKGQNGIGNAVVYGSKEGIVIESVKAGEAAIYSVSGELVKIAQVKEGRNIIKLPAGVYIINQNKVIVY